jgi:hypothetical protein
MSASVPAMPSQGTEAFVGKYKHKFKSAYVCAEDLIQTKPSLCHGRTIVLNLNRGSIMGKLSRYSNELWAERPRNRGSIPGRGIFLHSLQTESGVRSNGYEGELSPGVKRPGRGADYLPPSSA